MPRVNRAMRWAVPLIALGLVVGGCSSSSSTDNSNAGVGAVGTKNDINPQDVSALQDGGNLRLPISSYPANFNTLTNDGNDVDTAAIMDVVMPRAFMADASASVTLNPDYFTSVELTSTSPQVVTYTINPKAVWSDGSPITWEDLQSQISAMSGKDKAFEISNSGGYDRVDNVKQGVDDRQAVVTYRTPYAEWKGLFSGSTLLMPKVATATADAFNQGSLDAPPISSGPFVISNIDKGQNRITLTRNPKWWGATPKLDTITFSVLDAAALVPALTNNEIDAAGLASIDDRKTAEGAAGVAIRVSPTNQWYHLTYNGAPGAILSDQALRVAITKGIDRQGIVTASLNGLTQDPKPLGNHVYVNGQNGYQDNSTAYDPAAAASELDALGWKMNGDVREKDGKQLVLRDVVYQSTSTVQIAQIVQQNLAKIGVKLNIDAKGGTGYFSDFVIPGDFDMTQFSWVGDSFPLSSLAQVYSYTGDNTQGNYGRIGSPELNTEIDAVASEIDPEKAIQMANDLDKKIWAEASDVPLQQSPGNIAVRANLANYGAKGLADYDYTKIGFMK